MRRAWGFLTAVVVALGWVGLASTPAAADTPRTVKVHLETTSGVDLVLHQVEMRSTASSPGTYSGRLWSNGYGTATFPKVPRGTFVIETTVRSASGPVTVRRQVAVGSSDVSVTLRARVDATLYGTVLRGDRPLTAAQVTARRLSSSTWSRSTLTASNGAWVMPDRSPGRYLVKADSRGDRFLTTYSGDTVREPDARAVVLEQGGAKHVGVRTVAAAFLTGKVVDGHGRPVEGLYVRAVNLDRFGTANAVTRAQGEYRLAGLATGRVRLEVIDTSFTVLARTTVDARQGAVVTVRTLRAVGSSGAAGVDLWSDGAGTTSVGGSSGVVVTGVVRHAGHGVQGVQVVIGTAEGAVTARVTTDADGMYEIPDVPAGSWRVYVRDPYTGGYRDASRAVTVGTDAVEAPPISVT